MFKNFVDLDKGQTFVESEVGVGGYIYYYMMMKFSKGKYR